MRPHVFHPDDLGAACIECYGFEDDPLHVSDPPEHPPEHRLEHPPEHHLRRTSWSAADLLSEEFAEPRFAVDGLLPEGLTFMCGAPKLGKSWMALGLGIAAAAGGRAFGTIPVTKGDALYLALEDSPRRLQSRLKVLLNGDGGPSGLQLETAWPRLDEGGIDRIDAWLDGHPDARIVLVDVWPRIRPRVTKRTDYYQADYDAAAPLQGLAIARGIAVVALYHTRKAEAEDFVETVQGTFGTAAAADTIVVVKRSRGQADATLYVTGRDVEEQELALRFEPAAGTWVLLGDAAEYKLGETRKEILDVIRAHGSLTPKQAAEVTTVNYELAKKTLQRMAQDGQLDAKAGAYSLRTPVPGVPLSPDEPALRDKGTVGTSVSKGRC
jgi:AAA domain